MSTHATSILRGRHTYLSWMLLITIGAVILSLFAGIPQTALAQVPSPNSANPLTAVTNEDTPVVVTFVIYLITLSSCQGFATDPF
ncbi:MAG: hypothetical protein R3E79_32280 [Caldilineaceae bacterium]